MIKVLLGLLLVIFLLPACSKKSGPTTSVVKPKYHHRFYDRKKDKRVSRTRAMRVRN